MKPHRAILIIAAALLLATPARGMTVSYTHDAAGRLAGVNYGGTSSTAYAYDRNGNLLARANSVNPFLSLAGRYSGLVLSATPDGNNEGFISIAVTRGGSFTGGLLLGAKRFLLTGMFDANGDAAPIALAFAGLPAVQLDLHLDLATGALTGSVSGGITATVSALASPYSAARRAPGGFVGKFTALLDATENVFTVPKGSGFALVTVKSSGAITMAGRLADGTVISQGSAFIDTTRWPIFVWLYAKKGRIEGFVDFAADPGTGDCAGGLDWLKPATTGGRYAAGFATTVNFLGARYRPPAKRHRALDLFNVSPNAVITLDGAPQDATLNTLNAIIVSPPNTDRLTLMLDPATGLLTGSFREGASRRILLGVLQQEANAGGGYFFSGAESLPFTLEAP